jgi:hypothetical protein
MITEKMIYRSLITVGAIVGIVYCGVHKELIGALGWTIIFIHSGKGLGEEFRKKH